MTKRRIFISSVQREFTDERRALKVYIHGDPLLRRYFEVFLFEDTPAADRRADEVYLDEVERCDIYIALLGEQYGFEDENGTSPTHHEFNHATTLGKQRLVFIKGTDDSNRYPKIQSLIREVGNQLVRRRFGSTPELTAAVYASLVNYLEHSSLIRTGPFDASACRNATIDDISAEKVRSFLGRARRARGYAVDENTPVTEALVHMNLLDKRRPSHAAVLLFGSVPQRFLISSEVKCMHFHGTAVRKPIPSYHIYKGTVFELVEQAVDFVMAKLNRSVGTREHGPEAPVEYEIPQPVVAEAIVNAVAHRDYTSKASVQVMLFADRLEVWNPGELPPPLTLEMLCRAHPSIPANPLIAEPLFLAKYIEKAGSGTLDMIELCEQAGLPAPQFKLEAGCFVIVLQRPAADVSPTTEQVRAHVGTKLVLSRDQVTGEVTGEVAGEVAGEVTGEVIKLLSVLQSRPTMTRAQAQDELGLKSQANFRERYLQPALNLNLIEMTIPDKPRSSKQKYRLTEKGRRTLARIKETG